MTPVLEAVDAVDVQPEVAVDRRTASEIAAAQKAMLQRLTAKVRLAEEYGWRSCAIERPETVGRWDAWGVPPGDVTRYPIPDWSAVLG